MIGLMEKYRPVSKPDISVELYRERVEYVSWAHPLRAWQTTHLPDGGWNRWTNRPNHIHWQAGDHNSILKQPAVSDLARAMRHAMDQHFNISKSSQ
jgi:thioesterase domain-containing protein